MVEAIWHSLDPVRNYIKNVEGYWMEKIILLEMKGKYTESHHYHPLIVLLYLQKYGILLFLRTLK